MDLDVIKAEIELMMKFVSALILLLLASLYNYIRTLDKNTLVNDIFLLKCVMQGKCLYLQEEGKIIAIEDHKITNLPCSTCDNRATCIKEDMPCACTHTINEIED